MKPKLYEIEVFDSRNTSTPQVLNRLIAEPADWRECIIKAKELSKTNPWPVVAREGEQTFCVYEKGERTEWSLDVYCVCGHPSAGIKEYGNSCETCLSS